MVIEYNKTTGRIFIKDEFEKITRTTGAFKFQVGFIFTKRDQEKLYILDFYNVDLNVGIEVNGGCHAKQNGNPDPFTPVKRKRPSKRLITTYLVLQMNS